MKPLQPWGGRTYTFADGKGLLAKANEEKLGDQLAGIAAADMRERARPRRSSNRFLASRAVPFLRLLTI